MTRISPTRAVLYGASIALHVGLAAGFSSIPQETRREATAIKMTETKRKPPPPPKAAEPPPAPPPEPKAEQTPARRTPAKAKAAAEPAPQAAPQAPAHPSLAGAMPDFGLSMSGGVGTGGMAIPMGGGASVAAAPASATAASKKLAPAAPAKAMGDGCDEPLIKPKPLSMPQPTYTERAREAKVEGRVRVEITVDERGKVTAARVVAGLGHGLDESALAAARSMTFQPATRCSKPANATFVVAMKFVLGS